MKPSIRPVALTFLGLLGATALWLTFAATDAGSRYRDDPRNLRSAVPLDGPRGRIITADGVVAAVDDPDGGRRYPTGSRYAHLVGYDTGGEAAGLEATRRRDLLTRDDGSITALLIRLTGGDLGPPDARLTLVDEIQRAAIDALAGRTGAVVALDPTTGAILAYAASPGFDPNDIVAGRLAPDDPGVAGLLDRVSRRLLPPGSTFKVVVVAAALEAGAGPTTAYDDSSAYTPPGGLPIGNATGRVCGDGQSITLLDAFVVSCNTVFAELAVDLGAGAVVGTATRFGFNAPIRWELGAEPSMIPAAPGLDVDPPALAQSGIGERDVRATPLLMALIAAAIANDGVAMAPHAVAAIVAPGGSIVSTTAARVVDRLMSTEVARTLRAMMVEVVARGTGAGAAVSDVEVAGKTGTAEGGGGPHAWFIGFAPADEPRIAIAVVVESAGRGATGGGVAAPIAARVIAAWVSAAGAPDG